jgi:hypothetical protein
MRASTAVRLRYPSFVTVNPKLQQVIHVVEAQVQRSPRVSAGIAGSLAVVVAITWYVVLSRRPTAFEVERRRREELALNGRITDGVVLDARTLDNQDSVSATPEVLVYSYSVAGLVYHCAQDVSSLPDRVLGFRIDQSVQVRYDPRNPGNSILVSEIWSGLWIRSNGMEARRPAASDAAKSSTANSI